jgi:hypothetical protein
MNLDNGDNMREILERRAAWSRRPELKARKALSFHENTLKKSIESQKITKMIKSVYNLSPDQYRGTNKTNPRKKFNGLVKIFTERKLYHHSRPLSQLERPI